MRCHIPCISISSFKTKKREQLCSSCGRVASNGDEKLPNLARKSRRLGDQFRYDVSFSPFVINDSSQSSLNNDKFPCIRPRDLDGARGDSNAANGPSSRFATRLTIKFDFSWHHGDTVATSRVKSHGILSKIISVRRR
jgi:hypothetical protein